MRVKIAVVQMEIKQFSPEENLRKAEEFIKKASSSSADIIIFPEDFITGPINEKREFADAEKKYRDYFQKLAKKYKIDIIPGSIIEEEKSRLFNTTYYIDSNGRVKARYRKINLWLTERKYLTPGNEISVFNTKYGKVGLIICWDLAFPELFRRMVAKGVRIVFCPSYWCYEDAGKGIKYDKNAEEKFIDSLCIARAFENEIILVFCNAAGKFQVNNKTLNLVGHSQISVPFKGAIRKLDHNREGMFIQEVDTEVVNVAESVYKIRKDVKTRVL
jgi:predicted amidohydrolase